MPDGLTPGLAFDVETPPRRRRRRPSLTIDAEAVVRSVLHRHDTILGDRDRSLWLDARLERYAKFRGLLETKLFPYEGAANVHMPIMMSAFLRQDAGLSNAVLTTRPLISAKATQARNADRAERVTEIVDAQMFLELPDAKRRAGDFITNFLLDGNAVAYCPWVTDRRTITETRFAPPAPPGVAEDAYLLTILLALFPTARAVSAVSASGLDFRVRYQDDDSRLEEATVRVYHDGEEAAPAFELVITRRADVFNGPVYHVLDIEDVLVRPRSANLQPPSEANPHGAPEVFLRVRYTVDILRHLQRAGVLNWLDREGLDKIVATARGGSGPSAGSAEELKQQKDDAEGTQTGSPDVLDDAEIGHLPVECLLCFDRWDLDGRGEQEDVFFVVAREARVLLEARRLTDRWPAARPYRPLAEAVFVPVPNRWYGISLLELSEHLYDLITGVLNLSIDAGKFANIPPFFYSSSAAFRPGTIRYAPGEGYPVPGVARDAVYFPSIATRDQSWALNLVSMAMQFYERQVGVTAAQHGQVPPGRASALRTFATTQALLLQGDVRADQVLLRLLNGFAQIAAHFHRMNRHLLPRRKEYRIWGYEPGHRQAYRTVGRDEIDAEMDFEFQAAFLNSNPAVLTQSIQTLLTVLVSPLMFQLGIVDPQKVYHLVKDFTKALRQDPARYLNPPSGTDRPAILAEEALSAILAGEVPVGVPLEGPEEHLRKLAEFQTSDQFGLLNQAQVGIYRAWLQQIGQAVRAERQARAAAEFQQRMLQAAGTGSPALGGGEPDIGSGVAAPEQNVGVAAEGLA